MRLLLLGVHDAPIRPQPRHGLHDIGGDIDELELGGVSSDGALKVGRLVAKRVGLNARLDFLAMPVRRPGDRRRDRRVDTP